MGPHESVPCDGLVVCAEYCDGGTLRSIIDEGRLHGAAKEDGQLGDPLMVSSTHVPSSQRNYIRPFEDLLCS
jgi:hypothetical protein